MIRAQRKKEFIFSNALICLVHDESFISCKIIYVITRICTCNFPSYSNNVGKTLFQLFLEQFDDLLVKILLGAAIISFVSS